MAVSLVQSVQMLNSTASATTYTGAPTITTSGGLAIAYISGESDTAGATPSISSLTLGGVAMTLQGAIPITAGGRAWSAIAILNNASITAGAISITTTVVQRAMAITVAEWAGHDTTTPVAQDFGNGGGSGSTSLTASAALINAGGVYTGVVTVDSGTPNTSIVANATETVFGTSGRTGSSAFSDNSWQGGYEPHPTTGTYSFGFSWTGGNYSTLKVVEINAAAGGGVSGTLAATESGADTAAASVTVAVSGAMAAQGTGGDTSAASGTVLVSGALAGAESGADAAAASGTVSVSGPMAASEAGADTFAGAGTVVSGISGGLAATEAGADSAASSGTVLVSGTLAAQGSGSDAAAASGSVAVSGGFSATETGTDIFAASGTNGAPIVLTGIWPGQRDGAFISGPRGADPIAAQRSITGL